MLAAAGAGLAGMAGIIPHKQSSSLSQNALGSKTLVATCGGQTSTLTSHQLPHQLPHRSSQGTGGSLATPGELDVLIRQVQVSL